MLHTLLSSFFSSFQPPQSSPIHPPSLQYPQVVPTAAGPISDRIPASSRPCVSQVTHFWTGTKNPTLGRQLTSPRSHHSLCVCVLVCGCVCMCVKKERKALLEQHESPRKCLKGSMGQIGEGTEWSRILKRKTARYSTAVRSSIHAITLLPGWDIFYSRNLHNNPTTLCICMAYHTNCIEVVSFITKI